MARKSLSDILHGDDGFFDGWHDVQAADEFGPVPAGAYITHLVASEPFNAKTRGTPGYKLSFKIIEGEHTGRRLWYDIWLTAGARTQAKRDFDKLGITDPKHQLERPLPAGIRCQCKVTLRKDDDGAEFNRVKTFTVVGIDPPEQDAFAPAPAGDGSGPVPPAIATGAADGDGQQPEPPQDAAGGGE